MPESSYLKGSSNDKSREKRDAEIQKRQQKFKNGFKDIKIEDVPLILEKQKMMVEYISNFRTNDQLKSELLNQLKRDRELLVDTGLLKVTSDSEETRDL